MLFYNKKGPTIIWFEDNTYKKINVLIALSYIKKYGVIDTYNLKNYNFYSLKILVYILVCEIDLKFPVQHKFGNV